MTSNLIWLSLVPHFSITGENQTEDDSEGSYKVKEILSDDLNDMIIDEVKSNEKNKTGDKFLDRTAPFMKEDFNQHSEEEVRR